ncbi:MAG TPA: glycosyltransferase [Hyphomonas sp.]|nr:glycosyltransferase [Hyphomonas sp.]
MKRTQVYTYDEIEFDQRAQLMVKIASNHCDVEVVCCNFEQGRQPSNAAVSRVFVNKRWSPIRRHLTFWIFMLKRANSARPQLIIAEDFFTCLPAFLIARYHRVPMIYDAHELLVPQKGEKITWRMWAWLCMDRFVARRADCVVAANPERAAVMQDRYRLPRKPLYLRNIPAGIDAPPLSRENTLARYPWFRKEMSNERIILYQGYLSEERNLDRFIRVICELPLEWRLVLVGDGPALGGLIKLADQLGVSNRVVSLGRVPATDLASIAQLADVGIVTYPFSGLNNMLCAPTKLYEYLLSGTPIISTSQPNVRKLMRELPFGETFDEGSTASEIAEKVIRVASRPRPQPAEIRRALISEHQKCIEEILRIIDHII